MKDKGWKPKLSAMQKLRARYYNTDHEEEHLEQCALMEWARVYTHRGALEKRPLSRALQRLFAIPNGGYRMLSTASKLKAEGVRAGVSDLFLAWPVATGRVVMTDFQNFYSGLWLEMKSRAPSSHLTPRQYDWLRKMEKDYACAVCYGWEEGRDYILMYVEGRWPGHTIQSSRPLKYDAEQADGVGEDD